MKKNILLLLASALLPLLSVQAATDITKCYGQSQTMTASKTGDSYQWYKDGVKISGATDKSYTANNLSANAKYTCEITTKGGTTNTGNLIPSGNFDFEPSAKPTSGGGIKFSDNIYDPIRNLHYNVDYEMYDFSTNGTCDPGHYTTTKNPNNIKSQYFSSVTPKSGTHMLACDGKNDSNWRVLYVRNIHVKAGQEYEFSCWVANIDKEYYDKNHGTVSLPKLKFTIDDGSGDKDLGRGYIAMDPPIKDGQPGDPWKLFSATYKATKDCDWVHISIYNSTAGTEGNDFAIDEVYFGATRNTSDVIDKEEFNLTVYDTFEYDFKTEAVCPSAQATITTTLVPAHGGTLEPAANYKYEWKLNGTTPVVSTNKDLQVTAPSTVGTESYVISTSSTVCYNSGAKSQTTSVKTKDCGRTEPIPHPEIIECPDKDVTLTADKAAGGKWSHDASNTDKTITVKSNSTVGQIDTYTYTSTTTDASGNSVTYIETFTVKTKDCSSTEDNTTHQIKEGETKTLVIPENKRCSSCTYRWYRINENGELELITGLDPNDPTYTPEKLENGDTFVGEVIGENNELRHTQNIRIDTYAPETFNECYDKKTDAGKTYTVTGKKAFDNWYQWQWIPEGSDTPVDFPEGTIETENEKITFNLEYFINNNNGNLPAKIHILERYGVENADKNPTQSDDSNGGGGITRSHMIKISCDEDFVSKEDGQLIYDASTKVLGKTENGTYLVIGSNYEYIDVFQQKEAGMASHKGVMHVVQEGMGNSKADTNGENENHYFIEVDGGDVAGEVFSIHSNMQITKGERYIFSTKARCTSISEGILTDSPAEIDFFVIINNKEHKLNPNTIILNHAEWLLYEFEYIAEEDAESVIIMVSDNNNRSDMNDFALDNIEFYKMPGGAEIPTTPGTSEAILAPTTRSAEETELNENGNYIYKKEYELIINPITHQYVEETSSPNKEYAKEVKLTYNDKNESVNFFFDPTAHEEGLTKYEDTNSLMTNTYGCQHFVHFTLNLVGLTPDLFFSPNGDDVHDKWMIGGIESAPNAHIMIYDRHSKLLYKTVASEFEGWDGTYNEKNMVQDDYWYVILVPETNETLSGHFTLKR